MQQEFITWISASSLPVLSQTALVEGLTDCCNRLAAARSSLSLLNLSTNCASLQRLALITSLADVLQLELISKIVYIKRTYEVLKGFSHINKKWWYNDISATISPIWIYNPWWHQLFEGAPVPFFQDQTLRKKKLKANIVRNMVQSLHLLFTLL